MMEGGPPVAPSSMDATAPTKTSVPTSAPSPAGGPQPSPLTPPRLPGATLIHSPPSGSLLFTNMEVPPQLARDMARAADSQAHNQPPAEPLDHSPVQRLLQTQVQATPQSQQTPPLPPATTQPPVIQAKPSTASQPLNPSPLESLQLSSSKSPQLPPTGGPKLPNPSLAPHPPVIYQPPRVPLAPGSIATLVLPTSTPRPLLVLPSPSPTLLVSSPRLMRLPLLLPTQTLQLLPPAMDSQGKKSVLLTTIKAPGGRVTPPLRLGQPSPATSWAPQATLVTTTRPPRAPHAGVIKFSSPAMVGQQIKVDLSSVVTTLTTPLPTNPVRKLELNEGDTIKQEQMEVQEVKTEVEVKKEAVDDGEGEMSLQCNEKIGDSPSPGKKKEGKVKKGVNSGQELSLLEPLPGGTMATTSSLATATNEFGMVQLGRGGVPASPRKDQGVRRIQDDSILCCEGCGCYGMAGEFTAQNSCSPACNRVILSRVREEARRAREQEAVAAKREERKAVTPQKRKKGEEGREVVVAAQRPGHYNSTYPWHCARRGFLWPAYLDWASAKAAPAHLFPPPLEAHGFQVGMKLEAVDPEHQALLCVVGVVEVVGHRLRLHFDGYGDSHDFWEAADSWRLFPAGWCAEHGQSLVPPKGYSPQGFCWSAYLAITSSLAAPEELFIGRAKTAEEGSALVKGWKVGDRLEALDLHDTDHDLAYVATVSNIMEGQVLIHFDGWSINHDYWARPDGPYVHPVGWAAGSKRRLIPPQDSQDTPATFTWAAHLASQGARPVPAWAFKASATSRDQTDFRAGQRLEAVDIHNPSLVRVASVAGVSGRRVKVHYDGWPEEFQVWVDDCSPGLHPVGWADRTGHPLQEPLTPEEVKYWGSRGGCPTPGCRGLGHIRGAKYSSHHSLAACPYSSRNLEGEEPLPDRLQGAERERIEERLCRAEPVDGVGRGASTRRKRQLLDESKRKSRGEKRRQESGESGDGEVNGDRAGSSASSSSEAVVTKEEGGAAKEEMGDFTAEWEERVRRSVFRPGYLPQPAPPGALPFLWEEHARMLLGPTGGAANAARAKQWTTDEVCRFISEIPNIEHREVADKLREEEVDGEALLSLTQADLTAILEIKLGPAIKIFNAITAVRMRRG